jgi:hypothetical protein
MNTRFIVFSTSSLNVLFVNYNAGFNLFIVDFAHTQLHKYSEILYRSKYCQIHVQYYNLRKIYHSEGHNYPLNIVISVYLIVTTKL